MNNDIPFKLVETWFWMAFSCKKNNVNICGINNIKACFGSVDAAIKKYPQLKID